MIMQEATVTDGINLLLMKEKEEGFGCITIMTNDDHEKCKTKHCQPNF